MPLWSDSGQQNLSRSQLKEVSGRTLILVMKQRNVPSSPFLPFHCFESNYGMWSCNSPLLIMQNPGWGGKPTCYQDKSRKIKTASLISSLNSCMNRKKIIFLDILWGTINPYLFKLLLSWFFCYLKLNTLSFDQLSSTTLGIKLGLKINSELSHLSFVEKSVEDMDEFLLESSVGITH